MQSETVAIADFVSASDDALPVCLGCGNSNRLVSLWDMLERYAFGFYEVVCHLENQYQHAKLRYSSSYPSAIDAPLREALSRSLSEMRKECDALALEHTSGLISHHEAQVLRKGEAYTYGEMLTDLDTLRFSFSAELRKRIFFRIQEEKK